MEATGRHDFVPKEAGELPFKKGDKLLILDYGDQVHWYRAQKDGHNGIVPENYIEITQANWYMGRISRAAAEDILKGYPFDGAFLVRLSESQPKDFSLSVKCGDSVQHFRILEANNQYFLWQERFDSINELVEHYRHNTVSRNSNNILLRDIDVAMIAEALYDFEPANEEGDTELGFKKGDLLEVCDDRDENWWGGRIGDRTGFFPRLYVQLRPPGIATTQSHCNTVIP